MLAVERGQGDQAAGLRRLLSSREPRLLALSGADPGEFARFALELALAFERDGTRVLLIDLTRGALARHAGCTLKYELMHVIDTHRRLEQVVVCGPREIPLLPAARGLRALSRSWNGRARFAEIVERAGDAPQLVIAVAPAEQLDALAQLVGFETLLFIGPNDGADLTRCYTALKRAQAAQPAPPHLVYAEQFDAGAALSAHVRLCETARSFLGRQPELAGRLCRHPANAARRGLPALNIDSLARAIHRWPPRLIAGAACSFRAAHGAHSTVAGGP
ncbi:MAG: hypothetical protein HY017_28340 [Betaproteobacteria bacterium]|nr:hypothetical protein [Betaproteobacteria bacterium]